MPYHLVGWGSRNLPFNECTMYFLHNVPSHMCSLYLGCAVSISSSGLLVIFQVQNKCHLSKIFFSTSFPINCSIAQLSSHLIYNFTYKCICICYLNIFHFSLPHQSLKDQTYLFVIIFLSLGRNIGPNVFDGLLNLNNEKVKIQTGPQSRTEMEMLVQIEKTVFGLRREAMIQPRYGQLGKLSYCQLLNISYMALNNVGQKIIIL